MPAPASPETRITAQSIPAAAPVAAPEARAAAPTVAARPTATASPLNLLCTAVVLLAFAPLAIVHASRLWALPHYQFFPMVLIGSFILAWSRWKDVKTLTPGDATITIAIVGFSWLLLGMSEVIYASNLTIVAALICLAGLVYGLGGWPLCRAQWPAWLFLWILVPLPFGLDKRLVNGMQSVTSVLASSVLDLMNIHHQLAGNVVELGSRRLLVEEACAGVNSLYALVACGLFLILLLRRSWIRGLLLLIASVGWILVCNVLRVTVIAIAQDRYQIDLVSGLRHDALGLCSFLLSLILIWSTDRLFLFFKPRWSGDSDPFANETAILPFGNFFSGLASRVALPVAVAFAFLLFIHVALHGTGMQEVFGSQDILPSVAKINEDSLPKAVDQWKQERYGEEHRSASNAFGEFTKAWFYRREMISASVSLDYPFPGYHDLTGCYTNQGWIVDKLTEHRVPKGSGQPEFFVEVRMHRSAYRTGYLLFTVCNPNGEYMESDRVGLSATVARWEKNFATLKTRLTKFGEAPADKAVSPAYQFQMFAESNAALNADETVAAQRLFFATADKLHRKVFGE